VADASTIAFRRMARTDLPALTKWLNTPHVYEWWGETSGAGWLGGPGAAAATAAMVEAEYSAALEGREPTEHYVIEHDGEAVGMIQTYRLANEPGYAAEIGEPTEGTAGVDLLIGDPDAIGRGLGPRVIDAFVRTVIFAAPELHRAVAGPDARNARSIRTFEKAGFRPVRDALVDHGHHVERVLVRDRVEQPGPPGR
jgi:aminoglycoside 6'-N-acetyltransferase